MKGELLVTSFTVSCRAPLRRIPWNTVRSATCWRVAMGEAPTSWALEWCI